MSCFWMKQFFLLTKNGTLNILRRSHFSKRSSMIIDASASSITEGARLNEKRMHGLSLVGRWFLSLVAEGRQIKSLTRLSQIATGNEDFPICILFPRIRRCCALFLGNMERSTKSECTALEK